MPSVVFRKTIFVLGAIVCLTAVGCRDTGSNQMNEASTHVAAARRAMREFDKLEQSVQETLTEAQTLPGKADAQTEMGKLLDDVRPKVTRQSALLLTADKELKAANKLPLPTDYHTYLKLLLDAVAKKEKARLLGVEALGATDEMLQDLPAGATLMQVPPAHIALVRMQSQSILQLIAEAGRLESRAETFRKQKGL